MTFCDHHNDLVWSSQWRLVPSQYAVTMTLCTHTVALCTLTEIVWPTQWLFVTLTMTTSVPYYQAFVTSTLVLRDHNNDSVTLTMMHCDAQNDFMWLHNDFMWHHDEYVWPHNDSVWPSKWLWGLHDDSVWPSKWHCVPHSKSLWPSRRHCESLQWLCVTFTMTLSDLHMFLCPHNESIWAHNEFVCPHNDSVYPHNEIWALIMTMCDLTMTLCPVIMSLGALTMILSDTHNNAV